MLMPVNIAWYVFCGILPVENAMKMKKLMLFLLPAVLLISCERDKLLPSDELPGWLKQRIADIEVQMSENPGTGFAVSAWIRYSWNDEYYYEWHNLISSSFPPIYDADGDMMAFAWDSNDEYQNGKCCKVYVWKGPSWNEAYDGW